MSDISIQSCKQNEIISPSFEEYNTDQVFHNLSVIERSFTVFTADN